MLPRVFNLAGATIIHLSVGESDGHLSRCVAVRSLVNIDHYSPPLRGIIVNNIHLLITDNK